MTAREKDKYEAKKADSKLYRAKVKNGEIQPVARGNRFV